MSVTDSGVGGPARVEPEPGHRDMSFPGLLRLLLTREGFLAMVTIGYGAVAGLISIPIVAYVLGPLINQPKEIWQDATLVGQNKQTVTLNSISIGDTKEVTFQANAPQAWAGTTAIQGAWLRRTSSHSFIAYAIYCPHLGCPVHWLSQPKIFLCPCHGSVFNSDGTVAGGPAPRPLFTFNVRVKNGRVQIKTHPLPIAT